MPRTSLSSCDKTFDNHIRDLSDKTFFVNSIATNPYPP